MKTINTTESKTIVLSSIAIEARKAEIIKQVEGLTGESLKESLTNLRDFFYKRLCRAQHSHCQKAVEESRVLLAGVKFAIADREQHGFM